VLSVLVVAAVSGLICKVGDDGKTPVAIPQAEIIAQRVAHRALAIQSTQAVLNRGYRTAVRGRLELDEHDVPNHLAILDGLATVKHMSRRLRKGSGTPELTTDDPEGRQTSGARPGRHRGLVPVSNLPSRAKLFLVGASVAIAGFTAWVSIRLFDTDSRPLAILLTVLACIGAIVVAVAVVTATRMLFSLRAMPYLLGRGMRRLFSRR